MEETPVNKKGEEVCIGRETSDPDVGITPVSGEEEGRKEAQTGVRF